MIYNIRERMKMADIVIRCPHCGHITNVQFLGVTKEKDCSECGTYKYKDFNIIADHGETEVKWKELEEWSEK
jgi:DNA-directed RNA polymerase subunit RPC12/RpoP